MIRYAMLLLFAVAVAGCDKAGTTFVEMQVHNGFLRRAEPIAIAPEVVVSKNEFTAWDGGFQGRQRLEVDGNGTLFFVPAGKDHLGNSFLYVGRRQGSMTAIEIELGGRIYRRLDIVNHQYMPSDESLREQLKLESWHNIGSSRYMSLRSIIWTWTGTDLWNLLGPSAPDAEDRLILCPERANGTIGYAKGTTTPPEWNVLIQALREFCPATTDSQPSSETAPK